MSDDKVLLELPFFDCGEDSYVILKTKSGTYRLKVGEDITDKLTEEGRRYIANHSHEGERKMKLTFPRVNNHSDPDFWLFALYEPQDKIDE